MRERDKEEDRVTQYVGLRQKRRPVVLVQQVCQVWCRPKQALLKAQGGEEGHVMQRVGWLVMADTLDSSDITPSGVAQDEAGTGEGARRGGGQ